jgi:hypothetical protein
MNTFIKSGIEFYYNNPIELFALTVSIIALAIAIMVFYIKP